MVIVVNTPRRSPMASGPFHFMIECEPHEKERHRTAHRGNSTITYTPSGTVDAQRLVALSYRKAAGPHELDPPESRYRVGLIYHLGVRTGRAKLKDIDNLIKLTFDGLNKVAWHDDRQVDELLYVHRIENASHPRTMVRIELITMED